MADYNNKGEERNLRPIFTAVWVFGATGKMTEGSYHFALTRSKQKEQAIVLFVFCVFYLW